MLRIFFSFSLYMLVAILFTVLSFVFRRRFRQRHLWNIPGPPNASVVSGHIHRMFNPYAFPFHEGLYKNYGRVARIYGFFGDIQLVVSDPKACNNIVVKDQNIFEETEAFIEAHMQVFGPALLSTLGDQHRKQRKLLNPVFNVKHIRYMTPIFYAVTRQLREKFNSMVSNGPQEINIADWMGKVALELIGQAGFGYSFGALEGKNDRFRHALKEYIPTSSSLAGPRTFLPYLRRIFHPKVLKLIGQSVPWRNLNHMIKLADVMGASARKIYETKKRLLNLGDDSDATTKQVGDGKDIISLLMQANATASEADRLSEEEVLAQITTLTIAATDTTSSALSRILHLLALHPDAQEKLREELKEACEANEELPYDQLVSLPHLEAICRETLRLYPPLSGVMRSTRSDVVLPLSTPIKGVDGRLIKEIFIPEDTNVFLHIYNLNRDTLIWGEDAAEWKPERWLAPLPKTVTEANIQGIYANTMTFIGGSRSCIGLKFSQLEMKVVLSQIVPVFRFSPSKDEIVWRFGNLSTPSVQGSVKSFSPKLPIVVSRV
ncbi:cytochrome P450 [Lactifluus volemus]|nr:cytochrome P450 [Lactifluus volemus]